MAEEATGRGSRRRLVIICSIGVVLAAAIAGGLALRDRGTPNATVRPSQTERLVRTTLIESVTLDGVLGYGVPQPIPHHLDGIVTSVPAPGATVAQGGILYTVDVRPVILFKGAIPAFRDIESGVSGVDVQQLEQNLADLGFGGGLTVDTRFSSATASAIQRWQRSLGLTETGIVELGRVVFLPGEVRVAQLTTGPGQRASSSGSVLSYTSTSRVVLADLEVTDRALAKVGEAVTVLLPGAKSVAATVAQVGTVATADVQAGGSQQGGGSGQQTATPTVQVTCTIADQTALGELDGAPVKVQLASQRRENVLAAPISALLALREGGYGVRVVDGGARRIVRVETGLFARGLVEVSGEGLAEGTEVETAAS